MPLLSAWRYTAGVHRTLVCALALLMLVWSATDRLGCLDDCGRADMTTTSVAPVPAADCPLCSGVVTTAIAPVTIEIARLEAVSDRLFVPPVLLLATPLDRPPRG